MLYTFYVAFAAFFSWESVRFALSEYASRVLTSTRVFHPLVVAAFTIVVLWPDWLRGLAAAVLAALIHVLVTRFTPDPTPNYTTQRRESRRPGLPSLP